MKGKYWIAAATAIAFAVCPSRAQDTLRLSLDSALAYAHSHATEILIADANVRAARVEVDGARMRMLPSVSASAQQGYSLAGGESSGQWSVGSSVTLFSGLTQVRALQQSQLTAEQSKLTQRQVRNSISLRVVQAYLTILMNKERLAYQQEVLHTSQQQRDEGEVKYAVGRILESDYMLLDASYASAQSEVETTRLTIDDNRWDLSTLLALDSTVVDALPMDDTMRAADRAVLPLDSLIARAKRTLPDWELSEQAVAQARLGVKMAQGAFSPTVSLGASYGGGWVGGSSSSSEGSTPNSSPSGAVTLGVSIPLFDRGTTISNLRSSKIALEKAELEHRQKIVDLHDELEDMHLASQQALSRYRASEALSEAYRASYEVYVLKYGEGAITTVEMLQQQDKYLSALNDYLQNKYNYLLSEMQIKIYTGETLTSTHTNSISR